MTREEFVNMRLDDVGVFIDFLRGNGYYDLVDDIVLLDDLNSEINDDLDFVVHCEGWSWQEVQDHLQDIDTYGDAFVHESDLVFNPMDEDEFEELLRDALDQLDADRFEWDETEEIEDPEFDLMKEFSIENTPSASDEDKEAVREMQKPSAIMPVYIALNISIGSGKNSETAHQTI